MAFQTITEAMGSAQNNPEEKLRTLPSSIVKPISMPPPKSTHCIECGDTGWRPLTAAEMAEEGIPFGYSASTNCTSCVRERILKQMDELQKVSLFTEHEKAYRLSSIVTTNRPDTARMVESCSDMLDGRASMLTIWGTSGNAKSVALIAMVNEFLDRGVPAMYVPSYDLLNWLQDAFNSNGDLKSETMYARLERVKAIRMLAVDELQGVKITDWRLEQLRNIIDRRWRDGLSGASYTLFAMNEDPAGLEDRIWSRLRDGRNAWSGQPVLENNDADMRPLLRRKS